MINVNSLYSSFALNSDVKERVFLEKLNNTINELYVNCNLNPLTPYSEMPKALTINDTLDIDERYYGSIYDNIAYLLFSNNDFKSEAIRKYREVNSSIYREHAKGKKLSARSW